MMPQPTPYMSRDVDTAAILARTEPVVYDAGDELPPLAGAALSAGQSAHYREHGYLLLPDLFSAAEVALLAEESALLQAQAAAGGPRPQVITEPGAGAVRSIFDVHRDNALFARLVRDPRLLDAARTILGSEVYIHQSRINYKPGFDGKEFFWHSDFETWHTEDGMPAMRALSCSILLTDNDEHNGPLLLMPGSHRHFISCVGATPERHYQQSLQRQQAGLPDPVLLRYLADLGGIVSCTGKAGSVVLFDCNLMHGSNGNITPYPRSNVFFVYNSVDNQLRQPQGGQPPRPEHIAARRDTGPLRPAPLT